MPPRRRALVGPSATPAPPPCAFPELPPQVPLKIFALLAPDERARCATVCRGWRATLSTPELWLHLDLSPTSAVPPSRRTLAAMQAVALRAAGGLLSLDASDVKDVALLLPWIKPNPNRRRLLSPHDLAAFIKRHAPRLEQLTLLRDVVNAPVSPEQAQELLAAAPALRCATLSIQAGDGGDAGTEAGRLLRREAPYDRVRLVEILVEGPTDAPSLLAQSAAHPDLRLYRFSSEELGAPEALQALVTAALQRKVWRLGFTECKLCPASAPALARLVSGGELAELGIYVEARGLLDEPAEEVFGAALRSSRTLKSLKLGLVCLWEDPAAAVMLIDAITAHPTLREIGLWSNIVPQGLKQRAGTAIAALVAADAPALRELYIASCDLCDVGMVPVFAALRQNRWLQVLDCSGNGLSDSFRQSVMLPAVRANTGLRRLVSDCREAVAEVQRRAAGEQA